MLTKESFAAAQNSSSVSPEELINRLNKALEEAAADGQYNAIKGMITNREVGVLKKYFDLTEYLSAHQMRWMIINGYNN